MPKIMIFLLNCYFVSLTVALYFNNLNNVSTFLDIISFKYFCILVCGSECISLLLSDLHCIFYFYLPVKFNLVEVRLSSIEDIVMILFRQQTAPNFLKASELHSHVKPMVIVPEPEPEPPEPDVQSESDMSESMVDMLVDTTSPPQVRENKIQILFLMGIKCSFFGLKIYIYYFIL